MALRLSRLGNIQSRVSSFSSNISRSTTSLRSAVGSINNSSFSAFTGNISDIASKIDSSITGPLGQINNFTSSIQSQVGGVVSNFSNQLLTNNKQIVNALGEIQGIANIQAGGISGGLLNKVTSNIGNITGVTEQLGNIRSFSGRLGSVGNITGQLGNFSDQALRTINNITGTTTALTTTLQGASTNINQSLLSSNNPIFRGVAGNLPSGFNNIENAVNNRVVGITSRVNNVVSSIDSVSNLLSNPERLTTELNNTLQGLVDSGINKLLQPISNIFSSVNDFANKIDINFGSINNLVGGSVGSLTQLITDPDSVFETSSNSRLDNSIPKEYATTGADGSTKLKNVLRAYNTYNYIISMGVLNVNEVNDPSLYREKGEFDITLLRSGGGNYNTKQTITGENAEQKEFLEYYIDDVEIDSIIAPNPNTGLALGTTLTFKVHEPYSMGKFLETVTAAALRKGYLNHAKAAFCLKIEFVGWDENGNIIQNSLAPPRYIPFTMINMEFDVTNQGSVYNVEAVITGDSATEDKVNRAKSPVEASGQTAADLLLIGSESITKTLNATVEDAEEKEILKSRYDRYLIVFPKENDSVFKAVKEGRIRQSSSLTSEVNTNESPQVQQQQVTQARKNNLYEQLTGWFSNEDRINQLGKSPIIENPSDGSNAPNSKPIVAWDANTQVVNRSAAGTAIPKNIRSVAFDAETSVITMIEEVIKNTKVITNAPENKRNDRKKLFFRIETYTFLDDSDPEAQVHLGRHPKVYVYAVHPYYYNEATVAGVAEATTDITPFKQDAKKEYNYYYTGRNEDIIDFNINFNLAFQNVIHGDLGNIKTAGLGGMYAATNDNNSVEQAEATRNRTDIKPEGGSSLERGTSIYNSSGGMRHDLSSAQKVALTDYVYNKLINSNVDMITADIEIWGDPYFIPTDLGNYAAPVMSKMLNQDFGMPCITDEVYCNINFRTPLDYKINGFVMDFPELVRPFHGTYKVWAATSRFSGGKFTQELKVYRPQQDDPGDVRGQNRTGTSDKVLGRKEAMNPNIGVGESLSAVGNLSGVGTGVGQVDYGLAAATIRQTGSFSNPATGETVTVASRTSNPISVVGNQPGVGGGVGQVDIGLAAGTVRQTGSFNNPGLRPPIGAR